MEPVDLGDMRAGDRVVSRSALAAEIRASLAIAGPLAGANLVQMAMGFTNTVMVGSIGGAALAAAGLGASLYFTTSMVCSGVLTAVAPLVAHAIGAGDPGLDNSPAGVGRRGSGGPGDEVRELGCDDGSDRLRRR